MITLSLSPSKIEKFRQWNEGEYKRDESDPDVITKEMLIETITGKSVWTPKAEFGSAFHAVMQFGAQKFFNKEDNLYHIKDDQMPNELVFDYETIKLADEYHKANPSITWEVWHTHTHILDNAFKILMNMRFDGVLGNCLKEHKTTTRADSNYEFFSRSTQWRCYLIATDAPKITYERFLYKEPSELQEGKTRRAGARDSIEVVQNSFHFYPSDDMVHYVNRNIRGLIRFCELNVDENGKSLMSYIVSRGT